MATRRSQSVEGQMLAGIADALWEHAFREGGRGRKPATPPAAYDAAADFLDLLSTDASQTPDQMWRAVEHLLPNPYAFGEAAFDISQGASVRGLSNYAVPLFDVEYNGDDLVWEGRSRHAIQPRQKKGRKTAKRDIERAMKAAGLHPRSAGLNADWSARAWHLGPSNDPNRVDGDWYIVEDEDGPADNFLLIQYFPEAENEGTMEPEDAREVYHEGDLDSVIEAAAEQLRLAKRNPHEPPCGRPRQNAALTDTEFDALVQEAANEAPMEHGFGARKVFIHRVYEGAKRLSPEIAQMSLVEFKRRLLSVWRRSRTLVLARADLVAGMDPTDVDASHTAAPGADFNFVERTASRNPTPNPPAGRWPSSDVASLLFPVDTFTAQQAKSWATSHGFRATKVDTTKRFHRLRQFETHGQPCRTVHFGDEVQAIICRGR